MIGVNTMILNKETLCDALTVYLNDGRYKRYVQVTAVKAKRGKFECVVEAVERKEK